LPLEVYQRLKLRRDTTDDLDGPINLRPPGDVLHVRILLAALSYPDSSSWNAGSAHKSNQRPSKSKFGRVRSSPYRPYGLAAQGRLSDAASANHLELVPSARTTVLHWSWSRMTVDMPHLIGSQLVPM
jgi:hypothetical protein